MNKMTKIVVGLGSIFFLILLGSSAYSQEYSNQFITAPVGGVYQPVGWSTFEASWLIGQTVRSPGWGTPLGQISNLVIDQANGRIALVILSDVPNLGAEQVAVPYSSLVRTGEYTFVLNVGTREMGSYPEGNTLYTLTSPPAFSDLYGIPSVMDANWVSEIYRHYGQVPYWKETGEKPLASMDLYESSRLMGTEVQTSEGMDVARVHDFVIDSSDGHIAFLVLSDVPGRADAYIAVPFSALSRRGENVFVLNTTEAKLASAPIFNKDQDLSNLRFAENVYRYFGQAPYWTERTEMAPAPIQTEPERMSPRKDSLEWYQMYGY
jgi:sporulation protein YlmC with PRC-barrel domain